MVVAPARVLRTGAAYLPLEPDAPAGRTAAMREDAAPGVRHRGRRAARDATRARAPGAGPRALRPRLRPLHLGLDRPAQGRGDLPPRDRQPPGVDAGRLRRSARARASCSRRRCGFDVSVWELFWPLHHRRDARGRPARRPPRPRALARHHPRQRDRHACTSCRRCSPRSSRSPRSPRPCAEPLQRVVASGEALPPDLARRAAPTLPGVALHNLYGPTEAAVDVTHWAVRPRRPGDGPDRRPGLEHRRLRAGRGAAARAPVGAPGELYLAGRPAGPRLPRPARR